MPSGDPGRSPRLLAQRAARDQGIVRSPDEARAYLQDRLAIFSKLLFWSFAALLVFLFAMYRRYPTVRPHDQDIVYVTGAVSLCLLAVIWRLLLVRRELTIDQLYGLDLFITVGSGATFGIVAVIASDLRASAYTCLIYEVFVVFTRALLVPGSARRTAVVSSIAFLPLVIGAVILAVGDETDMPGPAFVGGALLLESVAVLLAATGSRIIYGLRQKVTEAMQLGQYTLDRKIGEGGMGAVYHARHALLRRPTAVKLLLPDRVGPENLDRFEREVQHMSQLTHPNTVAVFDYGRSDGVLYYAMEYLGGIDLELLVKKYGPQPPGRTVHILVQVCGALQEAHDAGLIHRDIKPANIILCERGGMPDVAKVVDFGLVKEITRDASASTQIILGTPHYIAPEAVTDPDAIGPAVDLYALGAVGYYLLTGQRVFEGKTHVDVCLQHVTQAPTPPSQRGARVAPELEAIIMRCLAKQPGARFASARELADALAAVGKTPDWDRTASAQWWRDFASATEKARTATDAPTRTITVDVAQRELALATRISEAPADAPVDRDN
ncbi:MAG: serine/threonine protein kinase [Deltaproteobacteria bacterium]|nr:serine/threonine protein kinase [Deltaproteobacteria bacterium]